MDILEKLRSSPHPLGTLLGFISTDVTLKSTIDRRVITAELEALARHLTKGRAAGTWERKAISAAAVADLAALLETGAVTRAEAVKAVLGRRYVSLDGIVVEEADQEDELPGHRNAAGWGGPVMMPHDADGIQHDRTDLRPRAALKVGPKGYSHGWVKAGPGLSVKDVKSDADGNVVHKATGEVIGRITRVSSKAVAGHHADGTKVYEGPIKSGALVNIITHHNKTSNRLSALSKPSALASPKMPPSVPVKLNTTNAPRFYHGTRVQLKVGDLVEPGHKSAYNMLGNEKVYFTHSPRQAEKYARGIPSHGLTVHGKPQVYEVEPTGEYGDDPGSTYSYRSASPLRVVAVHPIPNAPLSQGYTLPANTVSNGVYHHGPKYIGQDADYQDDADWFEDQWYGKSFDNDDVDGPMWRLSDGEFLVKGAADYSDPNEVDAEHVMNQLRRNYPDKALGWMRGIRWIGPVKVPTDRFDTDDEDSWAASHQPDRIDHFAKEMKRGQHLHPIVAVQEPGEPDLKIIDGHHRYEAYKKRGKKALCYIGFVDSNGGPWDETHVYQVHPGASPANKVGPKGFEHGWRFVGVAPGRHVADPISGDHLEKVKSTAAEWNHKNSWETGGVDHTMHAIAAARGFDQHPKIGKIDESRPVLYRGFSGAMGFGDEGGNLHQFTHGDYRVGDNQMYGNGIYTGTKPFEQYGTSVRMQLDPHAKVADYDELDGELEHLSEPEKSIVGDDPGKLAALRGYDAYKRKSMVVVLNRGALTVESPTADKAATLSKEAAGYRDGSDAVHRCRNCSMFLAQGDDEVGRCTLVQGSIRTDAVCDHWDAKSAEKLGVKAWLPDLIKAGEGDEAATERLRHYWTHGEGGTAKVRWGEPGDFDRCVRHVAKYMENPQGYCAERHHDALGIWPATHAKEVRDATKAGPKGYVHGWIFVGAEGPHAPSDRESAAKSVDNWHEIRARADLSPTDDGIRQAWVDDAKCMQLQKALLTGEGEQPKSYWSLLNARPTGQRAASFADAVDAIQADHRFDHDVALHRGMAVDQAYLDQLKPGAVVHNKAFTATTTDPELAKTYARLRAESGAGDHQVTFKILVPKGTGYMPGDQFSKEVVLPRNGSLRVLRREGDQVVAEFSAA